VIEDGGYVVPFLHKAYSKKDNFCIGAVELTTKGLRQDEKIKLDDFYFPVLDVAKSRFKDEYESPLVGRAVVSSMQRLLPQESFSGRKALVIGFGAIGREVANALKAIGMVVVVSDLEPSAVAAARVRGFESSLSAPKLVNDVDLIVGTTGVTSINSDLISNMKSGTILSSTSSDLVEIDIEYLYKSFSTPQPQYEEGVGTYFFKETNPSKYHCLLLADGFPLNFYSGWGIPNKAIDPVLAQLFIGAIHIALKYKELSLGIQYNIMNDLVEEYGLIKDFLSTFDINT
jgi:adenosylhomocysteinase